MSFPYHVGQEPLYYNIKNTGRPQSKGDVFWSHYNDESNEPLYPFGFGLSYSTFEISAPELSSPTMNMDGELVATVTVKNTGKRAGAAPSRRMLQRTIAFWLLQCINERGLRTLSSFHAGPDSGSPEAARFWHGCLDERHNPFGLVQAD